VGFFITPRKLEDLAPLYVLCGAEPLLMERALRAIRDIAVPLSARAFNYDLIDGKGATAARIIAAAQTVPMMAARRMVFVREVSAMGAAELAKLVEVFAEPSPLTVLVMTTVKADKRLKFFSTANKAKYLIDLKPPRDLSRWVGEEVRALQVDMQPGAQTRLADVVGKDLARLSLAIEQLALYANGRSITSDDVDDLIANTRERTVFELTDAIGAGDGARAHVALAALFDQRQSAIGVVMMLARHLRQLAWCRIAINERTPKSEVGRVVGAPPFILDKLMGQSRRYTPSALSIATSRLAAADRGLKGQSPMMKTIGRQLGEQIIMARLVDELIALGQSQTARR